MVNNYLAGKLLRKKNSYFDDRKKVEIYKSVTFHNMHAYKKKSNYAYK
jgi:hypothetical protein